MSNTEYSFQSVLWLDDCRMPLLSGVQWVKNFEEFVRHLQHHGMPELVCFDHDLALEHTLNPPAAHIPYGEYREKTGLDAARYIVENRLPLQFWSVHSFNAQGRINIEAELRRYCPEGEVRGLKMPYRTIEPCAGYHFLKQGDPAASAGHG